MKDKDIRRLINMCDAPDEKSESAVSAEEVRSLVMAKVKGKKKEGFADTENIAYDFEFSHIYYAGRCCLNGNQQYLPILLCRWYLLLYWTGRGLAYHSWY